MGTAQQCHELYWTNPGSNTPLERTTVRTLTSHLKNDPSGFECIRMCVYKQKSCVHVPNPSAWVAGGTRHKVDFFKRNLTRSNSVFFFLLEWLQYQEACLPYNLSIAGSGIVGFIPFPRVLAQYEIQIASSSIWTRVSGSISYDGTITPRASPWCLSVCMYVMIQRGDKVIGVGRFL